MTAAVEELGVIHLMAAACRRLGVDLLGGGTDINAALAYCEQKIEQPAQTHLVLVTELYEGGDAQSMLARIAALKQSGVNVIVLLALSDDGHPGYDSNHAEKIAAMDSLVFACTPRSVP
jgi:NaMN:DMB phosphoribosyltransferase